MSKHTPGPWCVKPYNWQRGNVSVFAPRFGRAPYGACVAYTPCSDGVGGEAGALANARLIAAAPDLLEALKRMASIIDKMGDMPDGFIHPSPWQTLKCEEALEQARAAIAKAEGQQT